MRVDVLVAEIGSTTTTVNAFDGVETDQPRFIGQGQAATSVLEGDVCVGLNAAISSLSNQLGAVTIEYDQMLASSSAAGGLRMSVHGLVHDMTARAAKEAALGAGAIPQMVTSGRLRGIDLQRLEEIRPNIILLAGGVDHGERDTALYNAEMLAKLNFSIPLVYAGNVDNQEEVRLIFEGTKYRLHIVDNVYPKIDVLNIGPTQALIQSAFEEHIVHAPGMEHIRDLVDGPIVPTPGAVMACAQLLSESLGDLVIFDVGGATTDLHSVTDGSEEISRILISPEPRAKRTVEGDLGVYVNLDNVVQLMGADVLAQKLDIMEESLDSLIAHHPPIPESTAEVRLTETVARECVTRALQRHAGCIRSIYGLAGKRDIAEGKDLSNISYVIGTGGALTRLPHRENLLSNLRECNTAGERLMPTDDVQILFDNDYIIAPLGVLAELYPAASTGLALRSFGIREVLNAGDAERSSVELESN